MSSGKHSENRVPFVVVLLVSISVVLMSLLFWSMVVYEEDVTEYQAALHITNWTNRTLNLTIFVFASDTVQYELVMEHGSNVTLTVTWQDVEETTVFIHAVGEDVDAWLPYY